MNTYTKLLLKVIVFISLIYGLTTNVIAQSKFLPKVQDHTSIAQISTSNAEGTGVSFINPYTNVRDTYFAGLFLGTLNSVSTKFYCIDINTHLARNEDYWDEGSTPSEITYILNHYFPFKTGYAGILSNLNKEAAAIQFAIWHFSDNTDINTISGADDIKNRANAIVADAIANHNNVVPLQSLLILPSSQSLAQGTNATFDIYALDLNGNPISGLAVTISSSIGTLSAISGTTNASGHVGPITLAYSGTGTATINVKANVSIPQGTRYVYKAGANLKQKLVLATPAFDMKEETATVRWYTQTSQCNLNGFTTFTQGGWGSSSNSVPGKIRDLYFSTVFPSGLTVGGNFTIKLTSATAVKNYLPDGNTPAALTQNYIDPTTSINVLAGQLTALKLNIYFDAAGKIGTNSTDLGALVIATGPFTGTTVNAFLSLAEQALGGGSLSGYTFSQFNDAATAINENFDNGTVDNGFLSCEEQVCENTVGSYVYRDLNMNGTKDSGEPGIAGAVVELVQGTTVLATATTDVNGHYSFPNLVNGTYTVRLASSNFASGGVFFNTAQVKWYTKNSTSVNTTLNCNDNLSINFGYYKTCVSITKSSDKQSYIKGETITYSFLVENCGDIQLHGGIDVYDAMLKPTGDHLIKHIDILDPGQSTTFTLTYITGDNDCGQLVNTVRAEGHPVDGSATVIDESTWTVTIICEQKADLKIEKTVDNPNPQCDDNVNFTIKVTNLGPDSSSGIVVTDLLPSGLNYVSSTASQGTYNSTTGIWNVGTLASGAFATLIIKVKVDCGQLNNSAFDLGTAKDYNLFVIEDANQPSSDTQGKVAVGRDAYFATYSMGDQLPANSGDVLIVGRDLTFVSGAVYNGNVVYGHSTNLPQSSVSITGGTLRKDSPIDFAVEKSYLQNLSTTLSGYTVNGTTAFQYGGISLTGTDPFLNVFIVSGASLSTANNIAIDVPNGSVVLVNISGTSLSWTGGLTVTGTAITNVLYNFYQATDITISGIDIKGSVLAPFAAVNFVSGVINGQMICHSLTGSGQFNYALFGGHIPYDKKITNVATITSCSTPDPNSNNNSASATITITSTTGNNNDNGNGTWTNVCSFGPGEIIYTLAYYGNDIYAGTWGGKIYKSTDGGKNWIVINTGMNVSFIWSLNISGGVIFAATEKGVYKFNGSAWILTSLSGKDVHALVSYNGTLYAGTWGFGIFKSTDLGSTWIPFNDGLGAFLTIQSLTITSNGNIFAGTAGGGIFKCTDGTNWNKITCAYNMIWSLASTSTTIFAGTYGDGLYKSTDGGLTFTKVTSLNVAFVYSMSVDLSGKIYVSSLTNGVYMSSDNGNTWTSLGMSGYGVSAMVVNPSSDDIYVGTKEGQVYKISGNNNVTGVGDNYTTPTEYKLAQNYPNPFNPSTTIEFVVPQAGMYSLKVYNTLGQEVANLVENELASGLHKVTFDASRLASGMYIYKLSGNNVNVSKKMILMK
ncbi:MAG: choice-of-anchor A family protein [Melioribacter sp.]|nr:choice-of-anchor A family protein [Melioribacter sp.]